MQLKYRYMRLSDEMVSINSKSRNLRGAIPIIECYCLLTPAYDYVLVKLVCFKSHASSVDLGMNGLYESRFFVFVPPRTRLKARYRNKLTLQHTFVIQLIIIYMKYLSAWLTTRNYLHIGFCEWVSVNSNIYEAQGSHCIYLIFLPQTPPRRGRQIIPIALYNNITGIRTKDKKKRL